MKKILIFMTCLFAWVSMGIAQEVIENPKSPLNKNAGRVILLKTELSIKDMGEDYYFRTPYHIKISPEGFIFIQDREQLLQFDEQGKYIRNFLKKGKGPGEVEAVRYFCFFNGNLIAHDVRLNKILWFDMSGEVVKEFRLYEPIMFAQFVKYMNDEYYFLKSRMPVVKGEPRVVDYPNNLVVYYPEKKELRKLSVFATKSFVVTSGGGGGGEEVIFSQIRSLDVDESGRIYILDRGEAHLYIFDRDGNYIKTFGKKGQGPGELNFAFSLSVTS